MSALTAALAGLRRSEQPADLPSARRWVANRDPESALLTLAQQADEDETATYGDQRTLANAAIIGDYAIDAYSLNGGAL